MNCAVRYYSRSGNTRLVADAIAKAVDVQAVSVDGADAALPEPVDVLFVGGALYAYGLDKHLQRWLRSLDASKVRTAAVFSTSWISKHALDLIRRELEAKGIAVAGETFYVKGHATAGQLSQAADFARKSVGAAHMG